MPRLACRACGRQIYATVPLEALFAEERRCPRCGANMNNERRETDRRLRMRRLNPPDEPGPPDEVERRAIDRRQGSRRKEGARTSAPAASGAGWID